MYTIGYVIKKLRKEQKITQEVLCEGICTPSYLSRVENGETNVAEGTINALLQRLGQDSSRYLVYRTEKEFDLQDKLYRLRQYYSDKALSRHNELLKELMNNFDSYSASTQQTLMLHTYIELCEEKTWTKDDLLAYLMKALHLTKSKINFSKISNELFTQDEIMLIQNIATLHYELGETERALGNLEQLRIYLEDTRISPEFVSRSYPLVLLKLSNWLGLNGRYYESLLMSDKGIKYCIDYNDLELLGNFIYNKGYCLGKIGNSGDAITLITRAYHVALAANQISSANHYRNHLLVNYNYEI